MARRNRTSRRRNTRRRDRGNRREPKSSSDGAALLIVLGFLIWFFFIGTGVPDVAKDYSSQIEALGESEAVLVELAAFLAQQRQTLQEQEDYLSRLGEEADDLRLFLDTERPKVQAILDAQAREYQKNRWIELLASFVIGILASLAAQLIFRRFLHPGNREDTLDDTA